MNWRDAGDNTIVFHCIGGHDADMPPSYAEKMLKAHDAYSFGDHVSDPVAIVKRLLHLLGWCEVSGKIQTMACPSHRRREDG